MAAFWPEPAQFKATTRVLAYGGCAPRQYRSTATDHRGRITRRGPKTLRELLVPAAWVMLRYNACACGRSSA